MHLRTIIIAALIATGPMTARGASYVTAGQITDTGLWYKAEYEYYWPTEEPSWIVLPCAVARSYVCYLGVSLTLDMPGDPRGFRPYASTHMVTYKDGELLSVVRDRFIKKNGIAGHHTIPYWAGTNKGEEPYFHTALACFQYWDKPPTKPSEMLYGKDLPESSCTKFALPNPPTTNCGSLPSMVFDFGVTVPGSASGRQQHQQQNLRCDNVTEVTLKLSSALQLSRALEARMSVNGQTLDTTGVTLRTGGSNTPLDFGVTIYGNEGTGGEYTASSVLIMEYR